MLCPTVVLAYTTNTTDTQSAVLVLVTANQIDPGQWPQHSERNFPCQTLKISKVSLVVMGS
jgi:hypothetical protein